MFFHNGLLHSDPEVKTCQQGVTRMCANLTSDFKPMQIIPMKQK